jgi:hypothetical protein
VTVDEDRRNTAHSRRANIIQAFTHEFDREQAGSSADRFRQLLEGPPRRLVMSGDIDGIVSAMMLAAVSEWRVVAVVVASDRVRLDPDTELESLADPESTFGVDVFSTRFPSASNHPVLWGARRLGGRAEAGLACAEYDARIRARAQDVLMANPSLWVGIEASGENPANPLAATYRYPLGTAQFLLTLMESAGRAPRLFDREYLPWLIANCDGGVESIRRFPFNVPMWWSALAAAVGPGTLSEQLYRLATDQRANEFVDADRHLRYEEAHRAAHALNTKWNLQNASNDTIKDAVEWIGDISGWPDPFIGTSQSLGDWPEVAPLRDSLPLSGLPPGGIAELQRHLDGSLEAIHTSFSNFPEGWYLGWLSDRLAA